jgi:hypothetical protein
MNSDRPHWGFGPTVGWGLLLALFTLLVQSAVTLAYFMITQPAEALMESAFSSGTLISIVTIIGAVLSTAAIYAVIKRKKGALPAEYLGLHPVPRATLLKWLGYLAGYLVLSALMNVALGRDEVVEFMRDAYDSTPNIWLLWVALVIGAPVAEEVFFRGFLFPGLAASRLGTVGTIVVTSALWAALHIQYEIYDVGAIFVLGLLLGAARARTGSLVVPLILHAVVNFIATLETAIVAT